MRSRPGRASWWAVLAALLILGLPAAARADGAVRLATLEWPPYVGEALPGKGYVVKVVEEAFRRAGYGVELVFLPWPRAVAETLAGHYDACLPEYGSPERQERFAYSAPIPGGPLVLLRRRGAEIAYTGVQSLRPYSLCVVKGYLNTVALDTAAWLAREEAADDLGCLRMLAAGRVDLAVMDTYVAAHLLEAALPELRGQIEPLDPVLEHKSLHALFPRKAARSEPLREAFDAALRTMEQDGTLEALVRGRGF